jgi:hypothetical protein
MSTIVTSPTCRIVALHGIEIPSYSVYWVPRVAGAVPLR